MKKRALILLFLFLVVFVVACEKNKTKDKIDVASIIGSENMITDDCGLHFHWSYDVLNLNETTTYCSYVFVGRVVDYLETLDYGEFGSNTVYSVQVIENIKGKLIDNELIRISKLGGNIKGTDKFFVCPGDVLPEVGETYIFYSTVSEGIPYCGFQATKKVVENYKESEIYKKTVEACQNPVDIEAKPNETISVYDSNYKK